MSFFWGILPSDDANYKIRKIVGEIGRVFEGQQIPIRWSKPESYHIKVVFIGDVFPFFRKYIFRYQLKGVAFKSFKIRFNTVKLGFSKQYKDLIYLDILDGGQQLRDLVLDLRRRLHIQDNGNFVPHLTLGRVSKDLTDQEYTNISRDLSSVAKDLNIQNIEFDVDDICLYQDSAGNYSMAMSLRELSKI